MKKKVLKKVCGLFLSFCALFLCSFNFCSNVNLNKIDSAGASGFTDVNGLSNPVVSIEFVYFDSSTQSHTFTDLDPWQKDVSNGFSVYDLIYSLPGYPLNNCVSFYMNVNFGSALFQSAKYDFYVSSASPVWSLQAFDSDNRILTTRLEDYFFAPMDVMKVSKVTIDTINNELVPFKSVLFRFDGYFFRQMLPMYEQGYYDYYAFAYDKSQFVDGDVAYNQGWDSGYDSGYDLGYDEGYDEGHRLGESSGYNEGYNDASNGFPFDALISAVIDVPVRTFFGLFHFELLGVNMASFLLAMFTLAVIIIVIKKIIF